MQRVKLLDEEDLFRIRTLGFRGEALASIAAISHFEILTCNDETQGATRIFIKGGYLEQVGKSVSRKVRKSLSNVFFTIHLPA